ncbi:hypothetical protein [Rhizorhabdus dicambivorans]|nr:hypothetical protein [Rhizorhabdus dicambivorans]
MRPWSWIAVALLGAHGGVLAQAAPDDTIVVLGERDRQTKEQRFVEALAEPSRNGQLARFTDKVCPRSLGLSDKNNQDLARRMRRVAAAAHIPVAEEDCRPNVVVLFVQDRRSAIQRWRVDRPDFFAGLKPAQIDRLAAGTDPVAAWQIIRVKGRDGRPMGRVDSDIYDYMVNQQAVPSRIASAIEIDFSASFVLIEQKLIGNSSLVQLADYAAMRTLASTDPQAGDKQRLPTILSLFTSPGEPVPLSVTQWDLGYLTALYDTRLASRARDQQRAMGKTLERDGE